MYFNGFDTKVTVPFNVLLAPVDYLTVEAWIKPTSETPQIESIVTLGNLGWSVSLMCPGEAVQVGELG